jgi:flagellar biosynthetic protein FlhB
VSEAPDKDQKTHEPTERKLEEGRKKGDVAVSSEMKHAVMLVAAVIVLAGLGSMTAASFGSLFVRLWGGADDFTLTSSGAQDLTAGIMIEVGRSLAPIMGLLFGLALLTLFIQGRPTLAWSRVGPKWSKLSPIAGFGRLFGGRALIEFAKTLLKCIGVIGLALAVIWPKAVGLDQLIGADPVAIGGVATELVVTMVKAVAILVAAIALFDFFYQRWSFTQRMKMTFQEVKDEHKQNEGDPHFKAKRRSIAMQRSRTRMMAAVPGASVVVTNPTHYAVALKYEHGDMAAPVVVAKGVDAIALKIRELAGEAGVPIVESPPLARALYASVEIDRPIPVEHYAAVAEIIGYVMRLAKRKR